MVQAWTIGGRHKNKDKAFSPGPGAYTSRNSSVVKLKSPQWTIGTAERNSFKSRALSPGPGVYKTANDTNEGPKYHFGTKSVTDLDKFKKMVPGPGQYNPASDAFNKTAFSFGGRHDLHNKDLLNRPGPGAYGDKSTLSKTMGRFGTAQKGLPLASKMVINNPGPGQYGNPSSETYKKSAPKFGFGSSKRGDDKATKNRSMLPGPGQYAYQNKIGNEAPKYTLTPRRPDTTPAYGRTSPGPGIYNPSDDFSKTKSPQCKFGSSSRKDLRRDASPSPDAYNQTSLDSRKKSSPAFAFGNSNRPPLAKTGFTPGPGNYNSPSRIIEKNGYYMGEKLKTRDRDNNPGPGNYNPDDKFSKLKSPNCKIGSEKRGGNNKYKESVPGPGNYKFYNPMLDKGPHYGIGTEKRSKDLKSDTPGPGAYRIPVKIVDVPRYLIPNPDERYKFV